MQKNIINFIESKGLFLIWLLIIIIIGEVSDWLEYNPPWSFLKFIKFIGYYFLFSVIWLVIDVTVRQIKKQSN